MKDDHPMGEQQITPEMASKVVKNYLLPMFHKKRRDNTSLKIGNDFGVLTSRL